MVLPPRLLRPSLLLWLLRLLLLLLLLDRTAAAKTGGRAHARAVNTTRLHHQNRDRANSNVGHGEFFKGRICIGTNGRMSVPSNRELHYRNLRDRFTNCTYIDGNLELTWLEDSNFDLSFLQYIREVTGYVLISQVDVKRIILPRLQIIRGRTLFKINVRSEEFALMVILCNAFTLELPALRDILSGSVGIYQNFNMCHLSTIDWEEIMTGQNASLVHVHDYKTEERMCPECDKSCKSGCWGEGPENCQMFSKTNCSPQCYQGRCFGPNPRECCHLFCAGGCTGPKQSDCLACRNFIDDGICTQECPPMQTYNPTTYSWEPNVNGKYAYGATCVKNCPEHLLKDNGACVRTCPPKKTDVNGECVMCDGPCPKSCKGVTLVHSENIDNFKGCTIIDGNLEILEQSFRGFYDFFSHMSNNFTISNRISEMDPDKLEVFSTLKEVTGYVNIQSHHEKFVNLSYFRNLETIGGRQLTKDNFFASLYIVKTALRSLELKSLKKINSGAVVILENKNLCYVKDIAWTKIQKSTEHESLLQNNRAEKECEELGLVCDQQCTSDGCWGFGPDQCLECRNFKFGDTCLENCNHIGMYEAEDKKCLPCHSECASTCNGPKPENCTKCKNARDGPFCVSECPITKYRSETGHCLECHMNCVDGCLGPNNTIGSNGCNSCEKAVINGDVTVEKCLQKNESCPDGYYYEWVGPQEQGPLRPLAGKAICRKCHPRCKKCTGYGFHEQVCQECAKFKRGEQCEDECPDDHYVDENTQICVTCHTECRRCVGPEPSDCKKCRNLRIYLGGVSPADNSSSFNCSDVCPPEMPHKIFPNERTIEPYCSTEPANNKFNSPSQATSSNVLVISIGVVACLALVVAGFLIYSCQHRKESKEAVKMTMVLTGYGEDNEPLHTTHVLPNLAKLRIIKEAELRKGGILGFGAFGKVFQGVWVPEGETTKVPVAIKVLREETGVNASKEFLEEAYIMASVDHPNLLQLLAVCLTQEMMLITRLMPLGCLLDYVRTNKQKIGSKALLTWCTQIARGMAYLEEKRLVHRDLAARNVLVQTPSLVKITDFGLAKLLDINEDEYRAAGGKMPIKWLALECIQHRIFTHKSDVWAFGVTVWELLTYGGRPYENISARDVPELIENGLKLPQPSICSLDIYLIMVSCWMLDADSRPSFSNLAIKFAEMASDPGRYLVIQGDKFMKLPSYTPQDEKDMISNLATGIDAPESITEVEYLQPTFLEEGMTPTTSGGCSTAMDRSCYPSSSNCDFHHRVWHPNTSDSISDSTTQLDMAMRSPTKCSTDPRQYYNCGNINSDSSSSKYSTVQMKQTTSLDDISAEDAFDSPGRDSLSTHTRIGLPVDEDDYLIPFPPSQAVNGTSYIDLIGDSTKGEATARPSISPKLNAMTSKVKQGLDNPEYLLTSTENLHTLEEVSIPKNTNEGEPISLPVISSEQPTMEAPVGLVSQKSVEEESISDHEYYNDLQRELQPLRRNETAV